ncbi:hypothetical protein TMatcc_007086 [Talaromyces marneffei ATCC 18224]
MIRLTQALPVNGNSHCFKIFGLPFLSVCSIVTTTLVASGLETRSIAPPKPLIFPGSIPNTISGSSEPCLGYGPNPRIPFSDCSITSTDGSTKFGANIGIPIPKFAYMPFLNSFAARRTIRSRLLAVSPLPRADISSPSSLANVDSSGFNLAYFDDMFRLDDRHFGISAHGTVEVGRGVAELAVAEFICLPSLDECIVALDGFLHDVALSVKDSDVSRRSVEGHGTVTVVFEGQFTGLHDRAKGSWCIKRRNTCTARTASFGQCTLRSQLKLNLATQVHALKGLVLANVAGNHLLDLFAGEKQA